MSKTILLGGGSWGYGEWDQSPSGQYFISHPGIAGFLRNKGHTVINLSKAGGSNINSANRLQEFFEINPNPDLVIVFQTSWTRDLLTEDQAVLDDDLQQGYTVCRNRLISRFYYRLSKLAVANNLKIHLIGGCSDTLYLSNFQTEYPGVNVLCQSMVNLLINNDPAVAHAVHGHFTKDHASYITKLKKISNMSDTQTMLEDIQADIDRIKLMKENKSLFYPDGSHPNRHAHHLLFEYLQQQIEI